MPVYRIDDIPLPPPPPQRQYVIRRPVTDGRIQVDGRIEPGGWQLWDDRGRPVSGTITDDGLVTLNEPTTRRIYWSGWVTG
jgi:hypothetical protein